MEAGIFNFMDRRNKGGAYIQKTGTVEERERATATRTPSSVGGLFAGYMDFLRPRDGIRYRYFVRCSLVIQTMEMLQDDCEMLATGALNRPGLQEVRGKRSG
jgi:hypothetical protein